MGLAVKKLPLKLDILRKNIREYLLILRFKKTLISVIIIKQSSLAVRKKYLN